MPIPKVSRGRQRCARCPTLRPNPRATPPARAEALVESYRRLAAVFHDVLSEQSPEALLDRIAETLGRARPVPGPAHLRGGRERAASCVPVFARGSLGGGDPRQRDPATARGSPAGRSSTAARCSRTRPTSTPASPSCPGTPPDPEALITVPLIARGSLKGALNIYRIGEDASFDEDEFELARWFGDAAALALDNAQIRARLEHLAHTDSLTGLYNHRYFHERLRAELHRAGRAHDTRRADDARHRRLQARQRRLRPRRGRPGAPARSPTCSARPSAPPTPSAASAARSSPSSSRRAAPDDALGLAARLKEALAAEPGRRGRRDHALDRHRLRARARDERARAGRLRRGRDDDREGAGQGPRRRLRGRRRPSGPTRRPTGATSARSPT